MYISRRSVVVLVVFFFFQAFPLSAQIQALVRVDQQLLPILTSGKDYFEVLQFKKKVRTFDLDYKVRQGPSFGEGFVEVSDAKTDLDPLRDAPQKERTKPSAIRFRHEAVLVADRPLSNCYALLTFTSQGSVGTHIIPVGRLTQGNPKKIQVELRSQVDAVGSLHVFSEGLEVRSTAHREAYDVQAYYAGLRKDGPGLSAAELLKVEDVHQHKLSRDGRLLAVARNRDASKLLIVYDLETMKLLCENVVTEADNEIRNPTWVSDHEIVYVAESDYRASRSFFRLHLLDCRTGESTFLLDDITSIVASLAAQPDVLVLIDDRYMRPTSSVKFNIRTKKKFDDVEMTEGYSLFDRNGHDRINVSFEEDATK